MSAAVGRRRSETIGKAIQWTVFGSLLLFVVYLVSPLACAFCNSKESAKATMTLSNAKEIARATLLYGEDHDEAWPVGTVNGKKTVLGWTGRLNLKSRNESHDDPAPSLVAPIDMPRYARQNGGTGSSSHPDLWPISFALNANLANAPTLSAIEDPANGILLFEVEGAVAARGKDDAELLADRLSPVGDGTPAGLRDSIRPADAPRCRYAMGWLAKPWDVGPRRPQGAVFAFLDGHAKKPRPESFAMASKGWTFTISKAPNRSSSVR